MKIKRTALNEIIREELEFELLCRSLIAEAEKFSPKTKLPPEIEQVPKGALQAVVAGYKESSASQDLSKVAANFKMFLKKQGFANPCDYVEDPVNRMKLEEDAESLNMQTEKLQALIQKLDSEQVTLEEVLENMKKTARVLKSLTIVSVLGKIVTMPAGKYDLIGGDGAWASIKKFVTPDSLHQFEIPNITGIETQTWGTLGASMAALWFAHSVYKYLLTTGIPCGVVKLFQGVAPLVKASASVAFSVARGLAKWSYSWLREKLPKLARRAKLAGGDVGRAVKRKAGKPDFIDPERLSEETEFTNQLKQFIREELEAVFEKEENNPWAICTASVGREDKEKYEKCVKSVKRQNRSK